MPGITRSSPPHRLLALFLVATLLPSTALVWLGWRLIEQDRQLERERVREALDVAASEITAALERELSAIGRDLSALADPAASSLSSDQAIAVRLSTSGVTKQAGVRLLFVPQAAPDEPEAGAGLWRDGERAESVAKDLSAAAAAYGALTTSSNPAVRAGALHRLARIQNQMGRPEKALATYDALERVSGATVNGDPADLFARSARLLVLDRVGRADALRAEAAALAADLQRARWRLNRTTYVAYAESTARWTGSEIDTANPAFVLSEAVQDAWMSWRLNPAAAASQSERRLLSIGETDVLVISREDSGGLLVFAATPRFLSTAWQPVWPSGGLALTLENDRLGRPFVGIAPPAGGHVVRRPASETRLPWTVTVSSSETPATIAASGANRRMLLGGVLALLVLLLPATAYLVLRAVRRDLAVAKQQTDFVSAVSHEFRSPLTSLTHLTSLLRGERPLSDARRRQYYDTLDRETDRLRRFVETLLDFGRMQAGAARYRLAEIAPVPFVHGVVDEFRSDAASGGHAISLCLDETAPAVMADAEALGRALWNLLENAAKYSPPDAPIVVSVDQDVDAVAIRVADRGCGIPAEEQSHVFERFFRGDEATRSAVRGSGVGLAVVQHIVQAHGGEVQLESAHGSGSTFTIRLPAATSRVRERVAAGPYAPRPTERA